MSTTGSNTAASNKTTREIKHTRPGIRRQTTRQDKPPASRTLHARTHTRHDLPWSNGLTARQRTRPTTDGSKDKDTKSTSRRQKNRGRQAFTTTNEYELSRHDTYELDRRLLFMFFFSSFFSFHFFHRQCFPFFSSSTHVSFGGGGFALAGTTGGHSPGTMAYCTQAPGLGPTVRRTQEILTTYEDISPKTSITR